ncbi:MAG: OmpA family protein, partial [Gammaproteobacteria bacterium]
QYNLTLSNLSAGGVTGVTLTDRLPPGFRLQSGSVRINNNPANDPLISEDGRTLAFNLGALAASAVTDIRYVAAVGVGAEPGQAINTASASADGGLVSNTANARVLVQDDLITSRSFIMGRVIVGSCKADPADEGSVSIQLQSRAVMDEVQHRIALGVDTVPVNDLAVIVNLPEVSEYKPGSARLNGATVDDPVGSHNTLQFNLGNIAANEEPELVFATRSRSDVYGEFTLRAHAQFYPLGQSAANGDAPTLSPAVTNRYKDFPRSYRTRFESLSAELSQKDKDNIADLMHILHKQDIRQVTIVGHADKRKIRAASQHKFKNNKELSLARARAVATFLKQQFNFSDEQIVTAGAGIAKPVYYSEKLQGSTLSKEQQLSMNRRVEIFIELQDQLADTRFIVSQADSGNQSVRTIGPEGELSPPDLGLGAPGAQGIRLYLEDGRYVDTDEQGLYHFEGVRPGTHVVQIDESSVPDHLEIYQCENNTRFAGTPHSRFVDVQPGGMWRADFHVRKKPDIKSHGKISLQLNSSLKDDRIRYTAAIKGSTLRFIDRVLLVRLPAELQYVDNSATINGQAVNDPLIENRQLVFTLGDMSDRQWNTTLTFDARARMAVEGEYTTSAAVQFRTTDGNIQYSPQAINSMLYQSRTTERQIFEAGYQGKEVNLSDADQRDLDSVVDFLLDKQIRKIRVHGYTDNSPIPEHLENLYGDNKALSLARATRVAAYLARKLGVYSRQIEVVGHGAANPRASNDLEAGRRANRRTEVYVSYGDPGGRKELLINRDNSGELTVAVNTDVEITPEGKIKTEQGTAKPVELPQGILSISEDQRITKRVQSIRVRMDSRLIPVLTIDGQEISKQRIGLTAPEPDNGTNLYSYIGVDLGAEAGPHRIAVRGMGPFGNARFKQDIVYLRTGEISDVRMVSSEGNIADGKTPVRIRIQLLDASGEPVDAAVKLSYIDGNLKPDSDDVPASALDGLSTLRNNENMVTVDNDGYMEFTPVSQSGHYHATLAYNGITFEVSTYVTPQYRDWILVGLAEGTVGYNNVSGNMENLSAADIEDQFYSDGRMAFYAKGKVKGKYLLTAAFDSAKEKPEVSGNGLFGTIDPDKYYTLYGDNTQVQYDA